MNTSNMRSLAICMTFAMLFTTCTKDLDLEPAYGLNSASVYEDPGNYINVLAKVYAGLAVSGNQGPAGSPDIAGIDEGFSQYTRVMWNLQEICTDEAVCGWNDVGIPELNTMEWTASNSFVKAGYSRIYFQITLCNEFIRESSDSKLDERGFSDSDKNRIRMMNREARFLRALSYWHAIDLFGNVPFVTEEDAVGAFLPEQIDRASLFNYIESELLAIEGGMSAPKSNDYGRADQGAAWMLLAKLYLNSQVYTGVARYAQAAEYAQRIINSGAYALSTEYRFLFLADNDEAPAVNEIIFPVRFDAMNTQTWGGGTFFVHAFLGNDTQDPVEFGVNGGWAGYRTKQAFSSKMDTVGDTRNTLHTEGHQQLVEQIGVWTNGFPNSKYRNVTKTGDLPADADPSGNHVNTDFPMFRLADAYLIYAEAAARGSADMGTAMGYVNDLRQRAYGDNAHKVSSMTPLEVLDERARELHWEGHRRTDLVRFGLFTSGDYVWEYKGNSPTGVGVPDYINLYPLSADDVVANPNLVQNTGY
ncbi:MAG: RagB/SusD family nutrient uptake outer membrane protein [Bacteroidetes bacterium]|nr:RagB/SusD family nutrient uptake outer membrane protein [Bacteroidota bacterium]